MPVQPSTEQKPVKKRKSSKPPAVSPGDHIEFSMTTSVKQRGSEHWIKFGTSTQVREGETPNQAKQRIGRFVEDALAQQVDSIVND